MLKKIFISSALALFVLGCNGQIALKGLYFMPRGDLGAVFKKKISAEIMYMSEFDGHWHVRAGIGYLNLKPRLDTFPVTGIISDGSGTHVVPGYEVYHKYSIGYLFVGGDFRFVEDVKLSPYIGLDLLIGATNEEKDSYYPLIESRTDRVGQVLGGIRLRVGTEYAFTEHLSAFIDLSSAGYLVTENGAFGHFEAGLGVHYIF